MNPPTAADDPLATNDGPDHEGIWQFAGRQLRASDFNTAIVHLYRGEMARSNAWRGRLDATTNWAVVTTGAALTFAFGAASNDPVVLPIVSVLVVLFLFIEARRYRYYELWTHRVRLMEKHFFSNLLSAAPSGDGSSEDDSAERLTESLLRPAFPISLLEALGRRYRRNYAPLFVVLAGSWLVKVALHPTAVSSLPELFDRAAVGPIPGWMVLLVGLVFNAALIAMGLLTVGLRQSDTEVFADTSGLFLRFFRRLKAASSEALDVDISSLLPALPSSGRRQLVYIISDQPEEISKPILAELNRGVTLLRGQGMYTGKEHSILLCVVRGRQADRLKAIVHKHDPNAFVIITGALDVRGQGFRPLDG